MPLEKISPVRSSHALPARSDMGRAPSGMLGGAVLARLSRAGGAARRAELVRAVPDRAELRRLVAAGLVERVGHATYALPGAHPDLVVAARFDGLVDCLSAARLHGLPSFERPARIHLVVPRNRSGGRRDLADLRQVLLHRTDRAAESPLVAGRVQAPGRLLARMLVCRPRDEAVIALDHALYKGMVTLDDVLRHLPPNAPAGARSALALADAGGQSIIETLARLALVEEGFEVRTQPSFDGVGDVDLLVEGWVVIECDGYEYHSGRAEFAKDRRRDRILHAGGLVVLRFTYVDIVTDPGCVVRAVRAVLAARAAGGLLRPVG